MEGLSARNWWIIAIKGIASMILGVITLTSEHMMASKFVYYFALLLLGLGILGIYISINNMVRSSTWALWFVEGIGSILLGVLSLLYKLPVAAFLLDFVIGLWLLIICIQPIVFLFRYYRESRNLYIWIYSILLLVFALVLIFGFIRSFFNSGAIYGNVSSYIIAGVIVAIYGALTLVLSFQHKRMPL